MLTSKTNSYFGWIGVLMRTFLSYCHNVWRYLTFCLPCRLSSRDLICYTLPCQPSDKGYNVRYQDTASPVTRTHANTEPDKWSRNLFQILSLLPEKRDHQNLDNGAEKQINLYFVRTLIYGYVRNLNMSIRTNTEAHIILKVPCGLFMKAYFCISLK